MFARCVRTSLRAAVLIALSAITAGAQKTIHIPADQPSIQAGINAASTGDTVLVAPGTYYENLDFKGKAITVTSSDGTAKTIIDGGGKDATVHFAHQELRSSVISNFTIRNGGTLPSSSNYEGGGIVVDGAAPSILNNIITANNSHAIQVEFGAALIQGNELSGTLGTGSTFFEGSAVILSGNSSLPGYPHSSLINNVIQNNLNAHGYDGGGIGLWAVEGTVIQGNIIRNNATSGQGGAIVSFNTDAMSIIGNLIYGNKAGTGGAIALLIPGESAGPFIGVIASNTIYGNTASASSSSGSNLSAAVYIEGNLGQYAMVNNIIVGSGAGTAAVNCGTGYNYLSYTPLVFDHNDIYNPGGSPFGGACPDQTGIYGNISADPAFVSASSSDFHLRSGSPAIDTGNNSAPLLLSTDLDGHPRIFDSNALGFPVVDMGAYELAGLLDATPTKLTLVPSTFYPFQGFPYGNSNTFILTAQLSSSLGVPQGPVTFYEDGTSVGVVNADASGTATLQPPVPTPGTHAFVATYDGQGTFPKAVSVKFFVLFPKIPTSLKISSSPNPSFVGAPVTFTVTVTSPDGAVLSPVLLTENGVTLATLTPNSAGVATFVTSTLTVGFHDITAAFAGDTTHTAANAYAQQRVIDGYPTSITLSSSLNPSVITQNVTFTATVSSANGTPTGSIQFSDGATLLGAQPLSSSGSASLSTAALIAGGHTIAASFVPTGTFAPSTTTLFQQVQSGYSTVTTLSSSLNPSLVGQTVTFTAHISSSSGAPTGFFAISDNASPGGVIVPVDPSGNAFWTPPALARGVHTITAAFNPDAGFAASSASLVQTVKGLPSAASLSASAGTAAYGTPVTLNATVSSVLSSTAATPTGRVSFFDGANLIGSGVVSSSGLASFSSSALSAGQHIVSCVYPGDSTFDNASCAPVTVTITSAPTAITLVPASNPAYALSPLAFSAHLTANGQPVPSAPINFTIVGGPSGTLSGTATTDATGTAAFIFPGFPPGAFAVSAAFAGTNAFQAASTSPLTETVLPNPTTTALNAQPNPARQLQAITITAAVANTTSAAPPAGLVTFFEGAAPLGASVLTGAAPTASLPIATLSVGTHAVYAVYTPANAAFLASQSATITITVLPQDFTITLSDPAFTLQTGHHHPTTISFTSVGGLSGTMTHTCGALPVYVTCQWTKSSDTLPANGTVSTSLVLDTNQLPGFIASVAQPGGATGRVPHSSRSTSRGEWAATTLALTFLLPLFSRKRRKHLPRLLSLLFLAALATTLTACGADKYPLSTPPGTYTVPITATTVSNGVTYTHTANLTLVVTP